MISTHAPLAGRDLVDLHRLGYAISFQPTRPLRGATDGLAQLLHDVVISTHAPLAGRDPVV